MSGPKPSPAAPIVMRAVKLIGGGRVLAHAEGATWMIRGGLPGELLRVVPERRRARIIEGEVIEVVGDAHPARLDQPCPHTGGCGGCDWPHVDPLTGAVLKNAVAAEAAARFPELDARIRLAPITTSPPAYRLRNRLHWDPRTRTLGFYAPRSWIVSPITHCRIISETLADRLPSLIQVLSKRCPSPVDCEVIEGQASIVAALRPARKGPRILATGWVPPPSADLGFDGFHRLTSAARILPGWGPQAVHIDLPVRLEVPIGSFFQGNRHLVPWLFERVATLVGGGEEPVIDLHGGVGFLAAAVRSVGRRDLTVVEPHALSASAAARNLPDVRVVASSAESFLQAHPELPANAVAMTDPPRSGMTSQLRQSIIKWRPRRLLMLGCDPATWSRDAADLIDHGYTLNHLELVDLFPFTHHVEILALLETG